MRQPSALSDQPQVSRPVRSSRLIADNFYSRL